MKVWYEVHELRRLIGIPTDYFIDYIELKDERSGEYIIVHESKVELIKENHEKQSIRK